MAESSWHSSLACTWLESEPRAAYLSPVTSSLQSCSCLLLAAMGFESWMLVLCALLLLVLGLLSFRWLDSDLTLLWAAWMGRRPGENLL